MSFEENDRKLLESYHDALSKFSIVCKENLTELWSRNETIEQWMENISSTLESLEATIDGINKKTKNSASWRSSVEVKTKSFRGDKIDDQINSWLLENPKAFIKDIKLSVEPVFDDGTGIMASAMIVYFQ